MSHRIILRAAILLSLLLVLAAMMFPIATNQRERKLAAWRASHPGSAVPAAYDASLAAASFESRCATCHEMADMKKWFAAKGGSDPQRRLLAFLKTHGKASDAENEAIARYLSETLSNRP